MKEFADDNNDPATALAETRRLVTQEGIDAIVPDVSLATPSDFLAQQQIPWFGPGYDTTYCEPGGWGFSVYGCIILEDPKVVPGSNWEQLYTELTTKQGIDEADRRDARDRQQLGQDGSPGHRVRGPGCRVRGGVRQGRRTRRRPRWSVTTPRTRRR